MTEARHPANVVLASSPLVGPMTMRTLAVAFGALGIPTVAAGAPPDLDAWLDRLADAADAAAHPWVLVGFSAAGPRLFAAADRLKPDGIVFLDARLPADGVAPDEGAGGFADLLDQLTDPDGLLPPWSSWWPAEVLADLIPDPDQRARFAAECPRLPRSLFSAPVPAPPYDGPCGFVALGDTYGPDLDEARRRGWPTRQLIDANHLSPLTDPSRVVEAVLDVVDELAM